MTIPNLKAPSNSVEAQIEEHVENNVSKNKKSTAIIMILTGVIICLLLIIMSLLLTPSPAPVVKEIVKEISVKEEKTEKIIDKKEVKKISEKRTIETDENKVIEKTIKEEKTKVEVKNNKEDNEQEIKLKEKTLDVNFNNKISDTLSALEKKDFRLALSSLADAEKLKPNEAIIKELKERIDLETKKITIQNLIRKAQIEEKKEQWKNALTYYEKILKIDENINSILVKKQRTKTYIKINENLNKIINKPERLQSDKVLDNAKKILQFVNIEIKEKKDLLYPLAQTPLLTKKIRKTQTIIKNASISVIVTILSDNLTHVVVYKVGDFGKLTAKKLNLRPGHYTIVGSRDGYRDVKKVLKVSSGDSSMVIRIQCRETI